MSENTPAHRFEIQVPLQRFSDGGMHYFEVPEDIALQFLAAGHKRLLVKIENQLELHAALMRVKDGPYYVMVSKRNLTTLNRKENQICQLLLQPDESEYQFEMPEVLAEVLASDPEAEARFQALTDGGKRSFIALVLQVKSVDARIERALRIARGLKAGVRNAPQLMKMR
jgi:hypothetical protein